MFRDAAASGRHGLRSRRHDGSPASQALEPDLLRARELIGWAELFVFAFPNWWGTMPARLKGFLDRVLQPGFAFREADGHYYGLLAPRTAELLIPMDVPPLVYRWLQGAPGRKAMARATLGLCGVATVAVTPFASPSHASEATRAGWLTQARDLGARLRHSPRRPVRRRLHAVGRWLRAVRPQFYPMSALAYTLGALMAAGTLDLPAFLLGLAPHIRRGNAGRSKVRAAVEHVFARQKGPMGLFIRTIGLARARVKIGMANIAYSIGRLAWQERRRGVA